MKKIKMNLKISEEAMSFANCGILFLKFWAVFLILLFKKHTFKTLFALSLAANIWAVASCSKAKVARDYNDHKAYVLEQKVDSLEILTGGR